MKNEKETLKKYAVAEAADLASSVRIGLVRTRKMSHWVQDDSVNNILFAKFASSTRENFV
ncbi:hypothetical protein RRF57_011967 [Xylaria bambusicola]|uniref:Uncharacterized protein n=1 Tax=Xylaria bambusicola TaxID=326684 RepID=A0AAN7UNR5_9PEZI